MPAHKRVLWLLNHTTLRNAEVKILRDMGFEVFTPKRFPKDDANMSASVTFEFDDGLTIPKNWLKYLNNFDFYSQKWPFFLAKFLNQNFDAAFLGFFPNMMTEAAKKFKNMIFIRAFGLAGHESYSNLIKGLDELALYRRFKTKDNIWFSYAYPQIEENEENWLKESSIFLPVGIDQGFVNQYFKKWTPEYNKVFFVCPRILSSNYYHQIYRWFKRELGQYPHVIAGNQSVLVNDPAVVGFLEEEKYYDLMKKCKVMFYHGQELRHLHYHPIEAIVMGMPLVYMAGGCIDYLTGKPLPGRCETIEEAKYKISRILNDDRVFIEELIESQEQIMAHFDISYVFSIWRKNYQKIIERDHDQLKTNSNSKITNQVGVWFNVHDPTLDLAKEGITRLQSFIIKACIENDMFVKIACLPWMKPSIINLLVAMECDMSKVQFAYNQKVPYIYKFYQLLTQSRIRPKRLIIDKLRNIIIFLKQLYSNKLKAYFIKSRNIVDLIQLLGIIILMSPFAIVYGMLYGVNFLFVKIKSLTSQKIFDVMNDLKQRYMLKLLNLYREMVFQEELFMSKVISKDDEVTAWLFQYPRVRFLSHVKKPTIVSVPDLVYLDFPVGYSEMIKGISDFEECIRKATKVVTFSNYVAQEHIIKQGYRSKKDVVVIRHGSIDLSEFLKIKSDENVNYRFRASLLLRDYFKKQQNEKPSFMNEYISGLPFGEFNCFFVSSQTRYHKNHLAIIKAYSILLRERYLNYKLFITGEFLFGTQEFINKELLNLDVISVHNLPPKIHASFYACSTLTLVPTLFEGGFPFVFSESLSLGTPVLMSKIPVVEEVLPKTLVKEICFDPYDINDIVRKVEWAVNNREHILEVELEVYNHLRKRTWRDVALEYFDLIKKVVYDNTFAN